MFSAPVQTDIDMIFKWESVHGYFVFDSFVYRFPNCFVLKFDCWGRFRSRVSLGLKSDKEEAVQSSISSAGQFGTPAILEQSGMGKPSVLGRIDIPIILNLSGVGSNLADHAVVSRIQKMLFL
ncbi:uncharacterized protein MELLADRAFT_96028 [Melampsora larici-populina 98AG31]|uniref:Glucose-methanol-choline oxidoreductase N-terminal domain-containing protein n=1 Tax=Melampsora larici-populina (strain 98AG31 / pathotype 3-4-7) TaxID=747676 RepID=F4SAM9_MELLP|nr:uncharacterized protein MELLADRAFT_96028 [Melampsora larici-populina 98AG31]EGF98308.1 hypothetical protein MELLADRAFT_96028 [Melampsora larici-populina 98AG31]